MLQPEAVDRLAQKRINWDFGPVNGFDFRVSRAELRIFIHDEINAATPNPAHAVRPAAPARDAGSESPTEPPNAGTHGPDRLLSHRTGDSARLLQPSGMANQRSRGSCPSDPRRQRRDPAVALETSPPRGLQDAAARRAATHRGEAESSAFADLDPEFIDLLRI